MSDKAILIPSIDTSQGRTYLLYEVVPDIDVALFDVAALGGAERILHIDGRHEQATQIKRLRNERLRTIRLSWANREMRLGKAWDHSDQDLWTVL